MRPYLHPAAPDPVKMEECVKRLKTTRAFPASAPKDGKVPVLFSKALSISIFESAFGM